MAVGSVGAGFPVITNVLAVSVGTVLLGRLPTLVIKRSCLPLLVGALCLASAGYAPNFILQIILNLGDKKQGQQKK